MEEKICDCNKNNPVMEGGGCCEECAEVIMKYMNEIIIPENQRKMGLITRGDLNEYNSGDITKEVIDAAIKRLYESFE